MSIMNNNSVKEKYRERNRISFSYNLKGGNLNLRGLSVTNMTSPELREKILKNNKYIFEFLK